jgi:protein-disulfide isomerase-like protein with CxxC motif
MAKHFFYVTDPMCSWCWGFSPVIHQINATFGDEAPIRVIVGGVHPYTKTAMTVQDNADFRFAKENGVTGFPTLLADDDGKASLVTAGFQKWESLVDPLTAWLNAGTTADS